MVQFSKETENEQKYIYCEYFASTFLEQDWITFRAPEYQLKEARDIFSKSGKNQQ